jgi:hypothetical protein
VLATSPTVPELYGYEGMDGGWKEGIS